MQTTSLKQSLKVIQRVYPDAMMLRNNEILINRVALGRKYNRPHTRLLLKFSRYGKYVQPYAYVDRGLQLRAGHSHHIDSGTESDMRSRGFSKLCIRIKKWNHRRSPLEFLQIVLRFLKNVRPDY